MDTIDDIVVAGGLAGLLAALIRLTVSWVIYLGGWQVLTLSHIYSLLLLNSISPGGLLIGTVGFASLWIIWGAVLAQLLTWYGKRYWYFKGPGLVFVSWPLVYLASQLAYRGPGGTPSSVNALVSLGVSLVAGVVAAGLLARWADWEQGRPSEPSTFSVYRRVQIHSDRRTKRRGRRR